MSQKFRKKKNEDEVDNDFSLWKKNLINILAVNSHKIEDLYLVNIDEFGDIINDKLFYKFTSQEINILNLPRVFVLNSESLLFFEKINNKFEKMKLEGKFLQKMLTLKVSEKIICFFFIDKDSKIRQGYFKIKDINDENKNKIIDEFQKGFFDFLKKNKKNINNDELYVQNENWEIFIFKSIKKNPNNFLDINKSMRIKYNNIKILPNKKSILDDKNKNIQNIEKNDNSKNEKNNLDKKKNGNYDIESILKYNKNHEMNPKKIVRTKSNSLFNNPLKKKKRMLVRLNSGNLDISHFLPFKEEFRKSTPGLIGLLKIGSLNYINATLQCFSNIGRLRNVLLNKYKYSNLEKNKNTNKKLSFALAEVLKNLWENLNQRYYSPEYFQKIIIEMNPFLNDKNENGVKIFIIFLIETMYKELDNPSNNIINNNIVIDNNFFDSYNNLIQESFNKNNSIIYDEFYGFTRDMTRCNFCSKVIYDIQAINNLFFPLEEVKVFIQYKSNYVRINDCFDYYEKLNNINSFQCNNCNKINKATLKRKLVHLPKTLIIFFNHGKNSNIDIVFEEYLNLKKYIIGEKSPYYYELIGVIFLHNKNEKNFIAYCKNNNNCEWYRYIDKTVNKSSFNEIKGNGLPYVLFYSYVNT